MKHYQIRQRIAANDFVVEEWSDEDSTPRIVDRRDSLDAITGPVVVGDPQSGWGVGQVSIWRPTTAEERAADPTMAHVLYLG